MNILKRISSDHEKQRLLMENISTTEADSAERRELFAQFNAVFQAHAAAEEHAFYAPLMRHPDSTDQSRHSVAEHQEAMELLETLEKTDMSSPEWLKMFKKRAHDNKHLMDEEETEVFKIAQETLGDEQLEQLLSDFDDRKKKELA
jgi:hemerythrin superfamily protein